MKAIGPATANARRPYVLSRCRGTRVDQLVISEQKPDLIETARNVEQSLVCSTRQSTHGRTRRIFSRGEQIRSLGTKVSQWGPGMESRWEPGAKPPEADDRV